MGSLTRASIPLPLVRISRRADRHFGGSNWVGALRNSGDRSHWHKRQNDKDRIACQMLNACGSERLPGKYWEPLFRSGARETAVRRAHGRGEPRSNWKRFALFIRPSASGSTSPRIISIVIHSVSEYREAKLRIFENQTDADVAVINAIERIPKLRPRTITFSAYSNGGDFRVSEGAILLPRRISVATGGYQAAWLA